MKNLTIRQFSALDYAGTEALNTLCTNLSFSGENISKIMLTSSGASEGKSFVSMNIMRTMAKLGYSVALVDADMRRSTLISRYGMEFEAGDSGAGLSHFLAGRAEIEDVVYRTNIDGAFLVPAGRLVSNSLPLLVSHRFGDLLDYLARSVDYVLVDAPPIGALIDGAQIAKSCDGTLIVVNYNQVHRRELIEVKEQIEQTGCMILGTVLNQVDMKNYIGRKYYYKSYYSNYDVESRGQKGSARRKVRKK